MRRFSLPLDVTNWRYSCEHYYQTETGGHKVTRSLGLDCYRDSDPDSDFLINGHPFRSMIKLHVSSGALGTRDEPLLLDTLGTQSEIRQVMGSLGHRPATTGEYATREFIGGVLIVPAGAWDELFTNRHELRFLTLDIAANGFEFSGFEDESWTYRSAQENILYILGFSYVIAPPEPPDTSE